MTEQTYRPREPADRIAAVAGDEGAPLGVCVFLSTHDLRLLGIDVATVSKIRYQVDHEKEVIELSETLE